MKTQQFSFQCSPFSMAPKAWHIVQVDRDQQIRVYDTEAQKFTGVHSLCSNDTKAILAKARELGVADGYERLAEKLGLSPWGQAPIASDGQPAK